MHPTSSYWPSHSCLLVREFLISIVEEVPGGGRVPWGLWVATVGQGTCHWAGVQVPPPRPTPGARRALPARCGSRPSSDGCLTSASSSLQRAIMCPWLEISPASVTPPGCLLDGGGSCWRSSRAPRLACGHSGGGDGSRIWAASGRDVEEKEEGCQWGGGQCPSQGGGARWGQLCLCRLCGPCLRRGHPAEMSRPVPSPASAAARAALLLGCAWLGSAAQSSSGRCFGGTGGRWGRDALLGHPDITSHGAQRGYLGIMVRAQGAALLPSLGVHVEKLRKT